VLGVYNDPPQRLGFRIRELAAAIDELCADSDSRSEGEPKQAAIVEARATDALPGMDALLDQLQQEHDALVESQVSLQYRLLGGMLVALFTAGLLLAGPGLRRSRTSSAQRAASEGSGSQRASNQPAASTPVSPPLSTSGPKTA